MCAQAAPTLDIPTVYDILIHMTPYMDDCAMHQSWCGADTSRAQKGVLSSQERRKRKHKEVRDLFTLSGTLAHCCTCIQQTHLIVSNAVLRCLLGTLHVAHMVHHMIQLLSAGE